MSESAVDTLVQRLDRLERENRLLKRLGTAVLVGIAALTLMGQAKPSKVQKLVEAERFVLRDTNGRMLAELEASYDVPALKFYRTNGTHRATLGGGLDGSTVLVLIDNSGKARAGVGLDHEGWPSLTLQQENGNPIASLNQNPEGGVHLILTGKDGKIQTVLGVPADNKPFLNLYDGISGRNRLSLGTGTDGSHALWLNDQEGTVRARLAVAANGIPALDFYDKDGKAFYQVGGTSARPEGNWPPEIYFNCLRLKQTNPTLDCSEYGRATEMIFRLLQR